MLGTYQPTTFPSVSSNRPPADAGLQTRQVLAHIADKWAVLILCRLSTAEVRRFSELRRSIDGVSQKMLAKTLRNLERDGLVRRRLYAGVPPRVDYSLTDLGASLVGPADGFRRWAEDHLDHVQRAQQSYDARTED